MADVPPTIALLGLGEAGGRFARDLREAGVAVAGGTRCPRRGPTRRAPPRLPTARTSS